MSALLIGRMVSALFWGIVADRYGRRPVLFVALGCIAVFSIGFGFSTSFWAAFTFRSELGVRLYHLRNITAQTPSLCGGRGVDRTRAPFLPCPNDNDNDNDNDSSELANRERARKAEREIQTGVTAHNVCPPRAFGRILCLSIHWGLGYDFLALISTDGHELSLLFAHCAPNTSHAAPKVFGRTVQRVEHPLVDPHLRDLRKGT